MNNKETKNNSKVLKIILIVCGSISVGLGVLGVLLPLLPTTPFLLLAAACYFRSSPKFYNWLIQSKYLGTYIKNYREHKSMFLPMKVFVIALLWLTILYSIFFVLENDYLKIFLIFIALSVSLHILMLRSLKTVKK